MANVLNGSFEDAGANASVAQSWDSGVNSTAEIMATFADSTNPTTYGETESFEQRWSSNQDYLFAFNPFTDIVAPLFDTLLGTGEAFEDFEEGWSINHGYSFDMGAIETAEFGDDLEDFEGFENGWSTNEDYSFSMGASAGASFDAALTPEAFEDFEEGWRSNEGYDFDMATTITASFDDGGASVEDFEETATPVDVTPDYLTGDFLSPGHPLEDGDRIQFEVVGMLPTGLSGSSFYYVRDKLTNSFKVSLAPAGTAATFTNNGIGPVTVIRDPRVFWLSFLS